jgi:SsrA-binding protein
MSSGVRVVRSGALWVNKSGDVMLILLNKTRLFSTSMSLYILWGSPDAGDILYLMAKKPTTKQTKPNQVVNRRARFDYQLGEEIVAGIVLTGQEVRAARDGHVQLKGAFVSIRSGELWLNNASFSLKLNQKGQANARTVDTAARKLLASRRQIEHFMAAKDRGMTIVPTKLLTSGNFIKIVIALAKGKKNYDKRETIKRRDQDRETKRLLARR